MSTKKKVIAVAVTTIALTAGSFGFADAATKSTKVSKTSFTTVSTQGLAGKPDRVAELSTLLSTLVTKGTITQSQADAIIAAAKTAEAAHDAARPEMGAKGGPKGPLEKQLTLVATTLGLDTKTVLTRLKAGDSLATIAGAKKDALIAALVADETKNIDAAVTAGKLTSAEATSIKADLSARVTAAVNATGAIGGPEGGPQGGPRGGKDGRGHGGPRGGMAGANAPTLPAPTTSSN